ncbi:MAG: hypothetical protein KDC38_04275 [Planctomycetes bacterium]|nr:hypothetical protein [Planctomycetota bacterium]
MASVVVSRAFHGCHSRSTDGFFFNDTATTETLQFDDLSPYLLLKNGNYLYKVPFRDDWAVLKVYYGSRGTVGNLYKSFENVVFAGQTSYMPKTRLRIERECLETWRKHGFRVYDIYPEVEVVAPNCPPGGYMLFEYKTGPKLNQYLADSTIDLEQRFSAYRRFLDEWGRRHEIAIREQDPRLVHENGDGKHVLIFDEELLWFDFEMIWRSRRRVDEQIGHEIVQYLWNISKNIPEELRERLLEETIEHYPSRDRLAAAPGFFLDHPRLLHRWGRQLDQNLRSRARKPTSKYNVARRLQEKLEVR